MTTRITGFVPIAHVIRRTPHAAASAIRKTAGYIRKMFDAAQQEALARAVDEILKRERPPQYIDDIGVFNQLHANTPPLPEYGYDPLSSWKRGVERAAAICQLNGFDTPGKRILEAACGDGMLGAALASFGHSIDLCDKEDWRDGRARNLPFLPLDLCESTALPREEYDLVVSYNAFEHLPDPKKALENLILACKPGGLVYLEFGPLYCSPWGLHVYRTVRIPYVQFLFSEGFLTARLNEIGIRDLGRDLTAPQFVNGWRPRDYAALWSSPSCELIAESRSQDKGHLQYVTRFPLAFQGRGLELDDLTVTNIRVVLRRRLS